MQNEGFKAVFDKNCKILILGSFPSVKSREVNFYYGNKQNRFWKMLEYTFEEKIGQTIEEKTNFLLSKKIALWDLVKSSDIENSKDTSLQNSNYVLNDINSLLPPNSNITKILCNGKLAYELFIKNFNTNLEVLYMPSTSPANPRLNLDTWKKELKNI